MARYSQWLIFAPVAILALFAPTANAQSQQGLHSVAYSVSDIPPIQSDDAYPICNEEIENNINRSYDGEPLEGCPDDMFMVHMTGTIIIPEHETILFYIAADDGGVIKIGGNEFGTWDDKGCSAEWVDLSDLPAGNSLLDFFFYEHGGGTCAMLAWNIDNQGWEIVPDGIARYSDAMVRHLLAESIEGPLDSGPNGLGVLHAGQVAWNAMARLELILREKK